MSAHVHADHDGHGHGGRGGERRLILACALTGLFMVAEAAGGILSGSLALLADAGHMLVDFAGLALAVVAARMARRPADRRRTYGYDRLGVLVAYSNGLVLFAITAVILYEAVQRLREPVAVMGGTMLAVALAGLAVNIVAFLVLHGGDREDLNLRGALLHVLGDLLGSLAAIGAAIVILATGWTPIDPILSAFVCLLILGNAWRLVRESGHVLLEGAPEGVGAEEVRAALAAVPGVADVHHVHLWMLTPRRRAATLHATLHEGADPGETVRLAKAALAAELRIGHATVEIERPGRCADASGIDHRHEGDRRQAGPDRRAPPHAAPGGPAREREDHRHDHPSPAGAPDAPVATLRPA